MSTSILEINHLEVSLGNTKVLNNVNFSLANGAIGCLLGESGCGKTTLLRTIAGFEHLSAGSIYLHGVAVAKAQNIDNKAIHLPAEKRRVGLMFQDFALFPHISVLQNIVFGLNHLSASDKQKRAQHLLELVGLEKYTLRYPHELSGGQQQRVALARALAPKPRLVLLDEPFSQLDQTWRESLALQMREILKHENVSALMVTHHQEEPLLMADFLGVMGDGHVLQWGTPYTLYHQPKSRKVAKTVGKASFLPALLNNEGKLLTSLGDFNFPQQHEFYVSVKKTSQSLNGQPLELLIRPDDVLYDEQSPHRAMVVTAIFMGENIRYQLRLADGNSLQAIMPSHLRFSCGEKIPIRLDCKHMMIYSI